MLFQHTLYQDGHSLDSPFGGRAAQHTDLWVMAPHLTASMPLVKQRNPSTKRYGYNAMFWCRASGGDLGIQDSLPVLYETADSHETWWLHAATALSAGLSTGGAITSLPVTAVRNAIPSGKTITLKDPTGAHTQSYTTTAITAAGATAIPVSSQTPNFAYPSGSLASPPAENWNRILNGINFLMNAGDAGYRTACATWMASAFTRGAVGGSWDGMFIDGVELSLAFYPASVEYSTAIGSVGAWPNDWQTAVLGWLDAVLPALRSAGVPKFIGNPSFMNSFLNVDGTSFAMQQICSAGRLDGVFNESFTDGGAGYEQNVTVGVMPGSMRDAAWAHDHGKIYIGNTAASVTGDRERAYRYATGAILMGADPTDPASLVLVSVAESPYTAGDVPWYGEFDRALQLGAPSGGFAVNADGTFIRQFANGTVTVNPTSVPARGVAPFDAAIAIANPGWVVVVDPAAAISGRTALDLNTGSIRVQQAGIDWGDAAVQSYLADQRWGSSPVDYRVPNRTVTIPLGLGMDDSGTEEASRAALAQKVALIQDQRGALMRQRAGGPPMYADIVDAQLNLPDVWGETGGIEPNVKLTLTCLPDFYGDEVTLQAMTGTGSVVGRLIDPATGNDAVIAGDYPARARIVVTDTSGNNQHGLIWDVRSRFYDSARTAARTYEAEALSPQNGAVTATLSGASGGSVVTHTTLPGGSWVSILTTNLASGGLPLTHRGSYRVWARCYSATATPQVRLLWGVGGLAVPIANDAIALPGSGDFYLLDLGEIRLDAAPVGAQQWLGAIQAQAASDNDPISIDVLYFQHVDESAGILGRSLIAPASSIAAQDSPGTAADVAGVGTLTWGSPANVEVAGDGNYATAAFTTSGSLTATTHYLQATNFAMSIPSGATIVGIVAEFLRAGGAFPNSHGSGGGVNDSRIRLVKAGTIQATDRSRGGGWRTSFEWDSFGGPTDMWGGTWTPTDVNNSGFGVVLSASLVGKAAGVTPIASVDGVSITVYYTFGSGFTVSEDAVIYASQTCELRTEGMFRTDPTGAVYGPVSEVQGALPRLPPSRLEQRPVELFVKATRGDIDPAPDSALDACSVTVRYRPCYLSRP